MNTVNIKGDDELNTYESIKNIVESTNDKQVLEKLESDVKELISKLTEQDFDLKEYLTKIECCLFTKINNIQFGLD